MTGARRHRLVIGVLICTLLAQISTSGRFLFAQQADVLDPVATREYAVALGFQKKSCSNRPQSDGHSSLASLAMTLEFQTPTIIWEFVSCSPATRKRLRHF